MASEETNPGVPGPSGATARRGRREADAELEALARSLQHDPGTTLNVPFVLVTGVVVALIVLSFSYQWPLWSSLGLLLVLAVVLVVAFLRRPPVAPVELTLQERQRVQRVVTEHGPRPAISLVRALYPKEHPAAAVRTVKLIVERLVAEDKPGR